jgi:hypothetical protein
MDILELTRVLCDGGGNFRTLHVPGKAALPVAQ